MGLALGRYVTLSMYSRAGYCGAYFWVWGLLTGFFYYFYCGGFWMGLFLPFFLRDYPFFGLDPW